jgi:choline dehydrogenase-like flavoprotein
MAYVVARPKGRYEIRESVHTPRGPRARSLANFARLTDEVLRTARLRATRPFDADAVRASAARAAAPVATEGHGRSAAGAPDPDQARHFVAASRRMAESLAPWPAAAEAGRPDPGDALIDLLNFAEQITAFTDHRPPEALAFPPLARLVDATEARESP